MSKYIILSILSILLAGCSTSNQTINIQQKPKLQIPKKIEPIVRKKGTLYTRRGPSLFSDKKDLQVGDIIQVEIQEGLSNSSKDNIKSSKDSSTGINGGTTTAPNSGNLAKKINSITNIGFKAGTKNSFSGKVETSNDEEYTTTISAIITQIYQNGNYFIEGSKEMLINGQKQIIQISGIIRPYDLTPDNKIYSYQLANLKILYNKAGTEMQSLKKPWGSKLIETISPF